MTKGETLLELHDRTHILVLPNAWDAASARIFEDAGFPAVATTSAGVANALGYPDGEAVPRDEMIAAVWRIARAVQVPVTADLEAGYGSSPEDAAETARLAIEAGASGMNLEDDEQRGLIEPARHVDKIKAIKEAAARAGVTFVLNARTDVYLRGGKGPEAFDAAVARVRAYRAAGADCVFVPGVQEGDSIGRLVRAVDAPLNVLAGPQTPPVAELQRLGVARVSIGSGAHRAAATLTATIARELRDAGTFTFTSAAMTYQALNALMRRHG
ncbi:MAG TPA: isocitrate lyase/phosphoenolpyruvate mutase family protein [Vicinamibacterales bacterium]|nr:isocitrate lyase/phosphoenolpyruvate mutase family protein [Vicinamibacterales bacterium]